MAAPQSSRWQHPRPGSREGKLQQLLAPHGRLPGILADRGKARTCSDQCEKSITATDQSQRQEDPGSEDSGTMTLVPLTVG